MEPSYQARKIIGRGLLGLLLLAVGGCFWIHHTSTVVRALAARPETPIRLAIFTQPAMLFTYTPAKRKTLVTLSPCKPAQKETCFDGNYDRFFIPKDPDQTTYLQNLWEGLTPWSKPATYPATQPDWRDKPAQIGRYLNAYANAWVQKRTNINPAEFFVLSLELMELTRTDFAIEQPQTSKKKKANKKAATELPLPAALPENTPLKVIILNASGKRGLAESLKQYLREQHAKGLLQVDVYDTGNYPTQEETSFIADSSGKLVQVTQVSRAIGISNEIRSEPPTGDIYDSRIVLGKDFKMPL